MDAAGFARIARQLLVRTAEHRGRCTEAAAEEGSSGHCHSDSQFIKDGLRNDWDKMSHRGCRGRQTVPGTIARPSTDGHEE